MTSRPETVTILFTDLVNSTDLLQRVGDEVAQRVFETHHRLLREAVAHHGGAETKWTGDGLMVAFPSATEAVRCAIAMQQAARRPAAGERLQIRVGLQAGEALRHNATDYFGTTVVIASRLCAQAQAGEILCAAIVHALIADASEFEFIDRGELSLKGISAPVSALEIRYEHDPLAMLATTPFVGRDDVIGTLAKKLEEARSGRGSLVMLVGEPGIGKTRTAEEFAAYAKHKGATVLRGRCYDGEWAPPFSPFVEAIKEYAATAPPELLAAQLGADAAVVARAVPALRERLPSIDEPAVPTEGERYRLLDAVASLFSAVAARAPLVLLLDDLHWADEGAIAMLRQCARIAPQHAMMIICGYRDVELDRTHPLADALGELRRETNYERIVLKGLPQADVGALLGLVAEQQVPEQFARTISDETGGNPFFIREVMLHLVEEKKVVQEDGRWVSAGSIAEMRIPEGVREVIGRRLSRLSASCNRMLAAASPMAGGFMWDEVRAFAGVPEDQLLDTLEEALGAQVLRETGSATYDFTHALFRHTLYDEMSTPRRVLLHRQIGEALELVHAGHIEQHLAELAHHFSEAAVGSDALKAIDYNVRAGNAAMGAISYESAVKHFERALALAADVVDWDITSSAEILITLGRARFAIGQRSEDTFIQAAEAGRDAGAYDIMIRAILREPRLSMAGPNNAALWPFFDDRLGPLLEEALESLPADRKTLRVCGLAFRAFLGRGTAGVTPKDNESLARSEEAEEMAREVGDPYALAYVLYWQQFLLASFPQHTGRQLARAEEMSALAHQLEDTALLRAAHMWRMLSLMMLGDPAMDEYLQEFHRSSEDLRQPQPSWWSSVCKAMRTLMKGDLAEAERQIIEATKFREQIVGDPYGRTEDLDDIGATFSQQFFVLRREQGRLREVEALVRAATEQFPDIPAWRAALALAYLETDQLERARELYEDVVRDREQLPATQFYNITLPVMAEVCERVGDTSRAAWFYAELEPNRHRMLHAGWRVSLGSADRFLGILAAMLSRFEDAQQHFEDALAMNMRMGARPSTARTQLDYARMLLKRGAASDGERAQQLLRAALETAREIGMAKVASDCEGLLAEV